MAKGKGSGIPQVDRSVELLDAMNTLSYSVQKLANTIDDNAGVFEEVIELFSVIIANEAVKRGVTTEELIAGTLARLGKTMFGGGRDE